MLICLFVITFFAVVASGPAGREVLDARRARRDRPLAKVIYLPSAACRERSD